MTILLLSVLLTLTAPAAADDTLGAANSLASGRFEEIAAQLELSAAQRKTVTDAVYSANTAKIDLEARVEKARLDVRHLLAAEPLDEKAVLKATDTLSAAEGELRRNRVQLVLAVRKSLTADQWTELVAIRQERKASRREAKDDE